MYVLSKTFQDYVPLLREFTNGEKRFFLATEVLAAIQSRKLSGGAFEKELVKLVEDRLATISREDCEKKWAEHVQGATFDELEIVLEEFRRTRRRAVFTLYDKNKYCVLAADAFVELLRYVISVKGIFRTADNFQWGTFRDKFFAEVYKIEPKFGVIDASAPLLLDVERVNYIHDEVNIWIEVEYACELDTVREVGSIEGKDLELYELQTKMQTLGVANLFMECRRYLAFLFASFKKDKFILTTFDLYEVIEQCQLLAIIIKLPERFKWLESQGHENEYPFNCVSYYDVMQQIEHNVHMWYSIPSRQFRKIYSFSRPIVLYKCKEQDYIYKQDAITLLMQQFPVSKNTPMENQMILYFLVFYLRHKEHQMKGVCELVPLDWNEFIMFREEFERNIKKPRKDLVFETPIANDAINSISAKLRTLCEGCDIGPVAQMLGNHVKDTNFETDYRNMVQVTLTSLDMFEEFIKDHGRLFSINEMKPNLRQPLRMFMAHGKKFFLATEVLRLLKLEKSVVGDFQVDIQNDVVNNSLATISYEELEEKWKEDVKSKLFEDVKMITTKIPRTKHRAIFIPYNRTKYCILLGDLFVEILRWMISVKGIFQVIRTPSSLLDIFGPKFEKITLAPVFIDVDEAEIIRNRIRTEFNNRFGELLKDVKDVKAVDDKGFDENDLNKQIEFLALNSSPQISQNTQNM